MLTCFRGDRQETCHGLLEPVQVLPDTKKGYVQVGIAKKEHVLAYFNTRGEDEIVYNSKKLDISIFKEV